MAEIGITVAGFDLRNQAALLVERPAFEDHRVERFVIGGRVDVHVGKRRGDQLRSGETLIEEFAPAQFIDEVFGNHLARAVMHGVLFQHFGFESPVFHDLRRKLHEVALDLRESAVFHVVEQEMERMAEFVEERFGLVERQQRRGVAHRTGEVADDAHHGSDALAVPVGLFDIVAAPRTLTLAVTREEVEIEHAQMRLVGVEHLVGDRLRMVERRHDGLEGDAVKPVGEVEDAALHVFEREIGAQHLLVECIVLLAQLLGVIPPVPRLERRARNVFLQEFVHLGQLLPGAVERRRPYLVQQRVDRIGRAGHLVGHDIGGVRRIAQHLGLLRTQTDEVVDELLVVVLIAVVAAVQVGLVDLFAQVALGRIGQERNQTGLMEREDPLVALAHRLRLLARGVADARRQSLQIVRRQFEREVVVLGQNVVAELHGRKRQLAVDLLQPGFLSGVEQGAGAHESVVGLPEQSALLGVESQRRAPVIDILHAGEKFLVEPDLIAVRREQGHHLLLQGLHPFVGLGGAEHAENQLGLREHLSGVVVSQNRILERRLVVVRGDGVDLGVVQRHAALEGGHEVFGADLIEGRHAERRVPLGEEGILPGAFRGVA